MNTIVSLSISADPDSRAALTGHVVFTVSEALFEMTLLDDEDGTAEIVADDVKRRVKALLTDPVQKENLRTLLAERRQRDAQDA